jgi:hypothetical protein
VKSATGYYSIILLERSEKLIAEAGDSSGTQRKGNFRRWKPLQNNGY